MSAAMRFALIVGLLLAAVAGIRLGVDHLIDIGVQREHARQAEAVNQQFREATRAGSQMAARAREEAQAARDFSTRLLLEKNRDRSALVSTEGLCASADGRPPVAVAQPEAAASGAASVAATGDDAAQLRDGAPAGVQLHLTAGALRVWNSALAGHDVPAGACGADGGAGRACAAATEATLDEAWDNLIVNAGSCTEDRIRYRRLVEYLKAREAQMQTIMEQR